MDTPGVCIDIMVRGGGFEQGEIANMFIERWFDWIVESIMLVLEDWVLAHSVD